VEVWIPDLGSGWVVGWLKSLRRLPDTREEQ
jgi:hypothetical protein